MRHSALYLNNERVYRSTSFGQIIAMHCIAVGQVEGGGGGLLDDETSGQMFPQVVEQFPRGPGAVGEL